jgi:adenosylhomocysteine nucleosidase
MDMCADRNDGPTTFARVLVVTAIREELAAFAGRRLPPGVLVAATGDGPRQAARAAAALCSQYRPSLLIGAGVAGALTPDLGVGDLVVAHRIVDAEGETPWPHAVLVVAAAAKPGARQGTLLSVDRPLVAAAEKAAWAAKVGPPPAAVDMESAAWARVASAHGIPFLIIRIVSDTAGEELPGYLSRCMDDEGGIRRSAVVLGALAHPGSIPTLFRMRNRVAECAARLAAFVARFAAEDI